MGTGQGWFGGAIELRVRKVPLWWESGSLIGINIPLRENTLPFFSTPRSENLLWIFFLFFFFSTLNLLLRFTLIWFGLNKRLRKGNEGAKVASPKCCYMCPSFPSPRPGLPSWGCPHPRYLRCFELTLLLLHAMD